MTAVERIVSRILFWGGAVSVAVMLIGLASYAVRVGVQGEALSVGRGVQSREAGDAPHVFISVRRVVEGLRHRPMDPLAIAAVGILALLATPVAAVVVAVPIFFATYDKRYGVVATVLAVALIGSLLIGGG